MKYSCETTINLGRDQVIALFDDPDNLHKWQEGLVSFEHATGEYGQAGSTSNIHYKMGRREVHMVETIVNRNVPDGFSATYEADGVRNLVENTFSEPEPGKTHWLVETEFKCKGILLNLMAKLMPGMFKKQTVKFMNDFKAFAEAQ